MFPLTKNRYKFFWCRSDEFAKHVTFSLFSRGRTFMVVVAGDVLRCVKEFYNKFLLFIYRNDFNRSKSDFRLNSQQQKPTESIAPNLTLMLQTQYISIHEFCSNLTSLLQFFYDIVNTMNMCCEKSF
jgi:hypothetical protein